MDQKENNHNKQNIKEMDYEYYQEQIRFYNNMYLSPIIQRSFLSIVSVIFLSLAILLIYGVYSLLPLRKEIKYSISTTDSIKRVASIVKANYYNNDPEFSIAKVLAENYVVKREGYDYSKISDQVRYMKNTSSNLVFKKYYSNINTDNIASPILKYKNDMIRLVTIKNVSLNRNEKEFTMIFESKAFNKDGSIAENNTYQTVLSYSMNEIQDYDSSKNDKNTLNFIVVDYKSKLIRQKDV